MGAAVGAVQIIPRDVLFEIIPADVSSFQEDDTNNYSQDAISVPSCWDKGRLTYA